jgi:hypothetical protein
MCSFPSHTPVERHFAHQFLSLCHRRCYIDRFPPRVFLCVTSHSATQYHPNSKPTLLSETARPSSAKMTSWRISCLPPLAALLLLVASLPSLAHRRRRVRLDDGRRLHLMGRLQELQNWRQPRYVAPFVGGTCSHACRDAFSEDVICATSSETEIDGWLTRLFAFDHSQCLTTRRGCTRWRR